MKIINIDGNDIFLDDKGLGQGKITISGHDGNYSYYWGAMGSNLETFICSINSSYFADKLMGNTSSSVMDVPATFAAIRKHIREELHLDWFREVEFQKEMRSILRSFQNECEEGGASEFVNGFIPRFVNRLPYYLIKDRWEEKWMREALDEGFVEHWNFIIYKPSPEYLRLCQLHKKIKEALSDQLVTY